MRDSTVVFISWAPHCSRSDSIAHRLGGRSFMVYAGWLGSNYLTAPLKYLVQAIRTFWILIRHRPRSVLVMAPPVITCFPVWIYCLLFRARFGIDAHTGAFLNPRWKKLAFLQRFCSRRAAVTIVTNEYLKSIITDWGANAIIVPDVPVDFPEPEAVEFTKAANLTVVASFCPDEPISEVLQAASRVPDVTFHITGDYNRLGAEAVASAPENVKFLGFLSRERYTGQLSASDAVVALTTRNHTMQRAAYEAIYLGRPVITSDFPVLRQSFPIGTVHVEPNAADIERGVREMTAAFDKHATEAVELCEHKLQAWKQNASNIRQCLAIHEDAQTAHVEAHQELEPPQNIAVQR